MTKYPSSWLAKFSSVSDAVFPVEMAALYGANETFGYLPVSITSSSEAASFLPDDFVGGRSELLK